MKIRDVLQGETQYKRYMLKNMLSIFFILIILFSGFALAFSIRMICFTCRYIILSFNAEIIGILVAFGLFASLAIKEGKNSFIYYYSIGDEKEMIFTDKACIEKLDDDIDETPWDKLRGMQMNEKGFAIFMVSRPVLLLSREKLAMNDISILEEVYSKYQAVWAINNKKKQQAIVKVQNHAEANKQEVIVTDHIENVMGNKAEKEIKKEDGFYVEITKKRYLRQYSLSRALHEKGGTLWLTIGACGITYFIGFLFNPVLFIIIFIVFLVGNLVIRRIRLSAYDKEKLSYTVYLDFSQGLVIKGFYNELSIKWEQVKKIQETKKDFFVFYSDIENIMLPKELLKSDEILFLHNKSY